MTLNILVDLWRSTRPNSTVMVSRTEASIVHGDMRFVAPTLAEAIRLAFDTEKAGPARVELPSGVRGAMEFARDVFAEQILFTQLAEGLPDSEGNERIVLACGARNFHMPAHGVSIAHRLLTDVLKDLPND